MMYSIQERVEIDEVFLETNSFARATARLFSYRDRNLHDQYVGKLSAKFIATCQ